MNDDVKCLFGYNLKRLRKNKKMSQMQLAETVGMTFTFISDIENGKNGFRQKVLKSWLLL